MLNAVKRMRCSHRSGVIFLAMITAIAWPTALTIRHSRFATLTLAKLVASLALHPPVSATEADYAPHHRLRRSLSSRRSLWVAVLSYMCKKLSFPHPSRCSLDTFSRLGEGFYSCALCKKLGFSRQLSQSAKSDSRAQPLPRGTPMQSAQGWRSQTIGEIFKGTDGACADPGPRIFPATGRQCRLPV